MFFTWLKERKARVATARQLYQTALTQSRDPIFYAELGVADTMDGRFDILSLHATLIMERLESLGPEGRKLAQAFFDVLFKQMELTLREIGVGDLGVPKHMKKMMKAFNGRAITYHAAMANHEHDELAHAISRNVYRTDSAQMPEGARVIAYYMKKCHENIRGNDIEDLRSGRVSFAPILQLQQKETRYA